MSSFNLVKIWLSVPASAPLMSWGKIDPRGGIFVKYQKTVYFNIFTSRGMRPGVTKMLLNQLFSCCPHSTQFIRLQSRVSRDLELVSDGPLEMGNLQTRRHRAVNISWSGWLLFLIDVRTHLSWPRSASFPPPVSHLTLRVFVSHSSKSQHDNIRASAPPQMINHWWKLTFIFNLFSILFSHL